MIAIPGNGLGKNWRYRLAAAVVARRMTKFASFRRVGSGSSNGGGCGGGGKKRRTKRWSLLFGLGLISLFAWHVASGIEWYSQRLGQGSPYLRLEGGRRSAIDIWKSPYSKYYYGCSQRGEHFLNGVQERSFNGYLLIATSGGLNQQRTGITDAVVVARILNATVVLPELDHRSFWKDDSDFASIFDVDWFIHYLSEDVTIVRRLPDKVMCSMEKPPYTMRLPRKSDTDYYLDQVLPILVRRRELGERIIRLMRTMSKRYIAIHLRFKPDMLAFSRCYYGGGDKEIYEVSEIIKRWTNLPDLSPDDEQSHSKCLLSPHAVGLMLRGLGFKNDSYVYVTSGEIYGREKTLQPLQYLFPNFHMKEMLAVDELRPYLSFSSQLAAIDYIVCDDSDVSVTNNNGNMAKILSGRRRYMGHKRTIRPNTKKLDRLFMARSRLDWETFSRKAKAYQRGFMGYPDEMRPGRGDFHEYPHSCICENPPAFLDDDGGERPSEQPISLARLKYLAG